MKPPYLTVLTTPIDKPTRRFQKRVRSHARRLFSPSRQSPVTSAYPGHFSLVRSVVHGLHTIGADFNHDPRCVADLARVVYAPANEALRQAALLKQGGRIDFLVAGPSNALFPDEAGRILHLPEIDLIIVASDWVADLYREAAPQLFHKTRICPAGVDAEVWKPGRAIRSRDALVYWKNNDDELCREVQSVLTSCGLVPRTIQYGHYVAPRFRQLLDEAVIAVFISDFETQGLALAEAWSMNVPTLVWNPKRDASYAGRSFNAGSSAPYLTAATGMEWNNVDELESLTRQALERIATFHPRTWVLQNLTDAICSARLLDVIRMNNGLRQ